MDIGSLENIEFRSGAAVTAAEPALEVDNDQPSDVETAELHRPTYRSSRSTIASGQARVNRVAGKRKENTESNQGDTQDKKRKSE